MLINGFKSATILFALLACVTRSDHATAAAPPDQTEVKRTVESGEDQHFCCDDVDPDTWSGEGCAAISKERINSCDKDMLYCSGPWEREAGVAACGPSPDDKDDGDRKVSDQHFCCQKVDPNTWTGEDCTTIPQELINSCAQVLYCDEKWTAKNGNVACE